MADRYGLPVSTSSPVAAERYQDGMDRLLSYGLGAEQAFAAALAADEGFALAHAGAGLFSFFQGDGRAARAAIGRAQELAASATRRERQHVGALAAVTSGETARGLALIDEHLGDFPRDALLVNQASSTMVVCYLRLGRLDRARRLLRRRLERRATPRDLAWLAQADAAVGAAARPGA
jgi:hypothetical protein